MSSIMIAGTSSGVGKTTIAMGLMSALKKKYTVQAFKVGPDYIDPAFHAYITGRPCSNLDSYLLSHEMIQYFYHKNMKGADIGIIEGVMGLFDGAEIQSDVGSSASIAKILNVPVILVVDGGKTSKSIAATVMGFANFDEQLNLSGVIFNNVGSEAHYELLKHAVEKYTNVKPLGYLLANSHFTMPERHLGLVPACEQQDLDQMFEDLGCAVASTVNIDGVYEIAYQHKMNETTGVDQYLPPVSEFNTRPVRIGIAKDEAFNFYYEDSLKLLSDFGAVEWVPFSPIHDKKLPDDLSALYIGGGFPEVFAKALSENTSFMKDLKKSLEAGIPCVAECGGLMYLSEKLLHFDEKVYEMVGWLCGETVMTKKLQKFGYATLSLKEACILGDVGEEIHVHEFHRSVANMKEHQVYELNKYKENQTVDTWQCGYQKGHVVAGYAHMHFGSQLSFGTHFVSNALTYQLKSGGRQTF